MPRTAPDNSPSVEEMLDALARVGYQLHKRGREWAGPCINCGSGTKRFHLKDRGDGKALFGCRHCIDGQGEKGKQAYREIMTKLWPDRDKKRSSRPDSLSRRPTAAITQRPKEQPKRNRGGSAATTKAQAAALWQASIEATGDATGSLAHIYLAGRQVWPPPELGIDLPATVSWIEAGAWPVALSHYKLPAQAAGAVLFALTDASRKIQAVQLEALTAQGRRLSQRWRRAYGPIKGAYFRVDAYNPGELRLVEGPVTALAARWLWPDSSVWATAGTSGLKALDIAHFKALSLPVVVVADGDRDGVEAGYKATDSLRMAGLRVSMPQPQDNGDAADWLSSQIDLHDGTLLEKWERYLSQRREED